MKIYLAGPFFTKFQREAIKECAKANRNLGHEVYVPMEHFIEGGEEMPNSVWARKVFEEDVKAINQCDKVIALYEGLMSDTGTAWEIGYAYGIGKPVVLADASASAPLSLMVVNSATNYKYFNKKNQK